MREEGLRPAAKGAALCRLNPAARVADLRARIYVLQDQVDGSGTADRPR